MLMLPQLLNDEVEYKRIAKLNAEYMFGFHFVLWVLIIFCNYFGDLFFLCIMPALLLQNKLFNRKEIFRD